MHIKFIFVGKRSELDKFCDEYIKRAKAFCDVEVSYVKESLSPKHTVPEIQKKIKQNSFVIILDEHGKQMSSFELSKLIGSINKPIVFIVGGAFGIDREFFKNSFLLSLSKLTLPHAIARLVLCESIYRSFTILNNLPYSKK